MWRQITTQFPILEFTEKIALLFIEDIQVFMFGIGGVSVLLRIAYWFGQWQDFFLDDEKFVFFDVCSLPFGLRHEAVIRVFSDLRGI